VLTFRTSLALAVFTALAAPPAFGATAQPASTSKPATHTTQTHTAQTQSAQNHATQAHTAQAHGTQTKGTQAAHGTRKGKSRGRRPRGQQAMESGRVTEIQQALIRVHYLSGEADGKWDERTKAAMQKYQTDQGWQTKLTPDARALKKLGLGPDYSNAINAKNATFAEPPPASTIPPAISDGFAEAAGIKK
jgi:peptidoglycan hydrolase-like protein with peptidoglycan-binding domain